MIYDRPEHLLKGGAQTTDRASDSFNELLLRILLEKYCYQGSALDAHRVFRLHDATPIYRVQKVKDSPRVSSRPRHSQTPCPPTLKSFPAIYVYSPLQHERQNDVVQHIHPHRFNFESCLPSLHEVTCGMKFSNHRLLLIESNRLHNVIQR